MKLKGSIEGDKVVIEKDSFEMILIALANQKFVGEAPPNGDAMAMGEEEYNKTQNDIQKAIDDIYKQATNILYSKPNKIQVFLRKIF